MAYFRKQLERRTYSQDRYYILIKRQKSGEATFSELTELDEIVNRVPDIREKVIIENFMSEDESDAGNSPNEQPPFIQKMRRRSFWDRIKSFFGHNYTSQFTVTRSGKLILFI